MQPQTLQRLPNCTSCYMYGTTTAVCMFEVKYKKLWTHYKNSNLLHQIPELASLNLHGIYNLTYRNLYTVERQMK